MSSKTPRIEIRPVRHYRGARYPSFLDPDPTLHPYPVPYPISRKLALAVAALGLGAAAPELAAQGGGKRPSIKNPFTLATSGLPHQTSMFGTGAPTRLKDEAARRVIEKVFREAGYLLRKDFPIKGKDVSFVASGFDPKKNVGFVFAGYDNLGADAILGWRALKPGRDTETESRLASLEWRLTSPEKKRLTLARGIKDEKRRNKELKALLKDFESRRVSLSETRRLAEREVASKRFVAVISTFDRRFSYYPQREVDPEEWRKALALKGKEMDRAVKRLYEQAARRVLDRLAENVRDYITWCRAQGAL